MQLNSMEDFQRDISYRALKREDGQVSLTALLRDRFHEIEAEVVADLETLKITAAGVDIRRSPTPDCGNVAARLDGLVGFRARPSRPGWWRTCSPAGTVW